VKGFDGSCWSPWLWFDIDRAGDLPEALAATRRLVGWLLESAKVDPAALLLFFSGSKGFHACCPMPMEAQPAADFNGRCRRLAEAIAKAAGAEPIDPAIYTRCQPFRSPNSRHAKTGFYKVRLSASDLDEWTIEQIQEHARSPRPFNLELPGGAGQLLRDMWDKTAAPDKPASPKPRTPHPEAVGGDNEDNGQTRLNTMTMDFIRFGAPEGERQRRLFAAAANLAEFGCPAVLAEALLLDPALDSGLPPHEARRSLLAGWEAGKEVHE
jgi:hypothetical protein